MDGKWLSALLRAAGFPRHSLRLRDSDDALREAAESSLRPLVPAERLAPLVDHILEESAGPVGDAPMHRAFADAKAERARWLAVREAAARSASEFRRRGRNRGQGSRAPGPR